MNATVFAVAFRAAMTNITADSNNQLQWTTGVTRLLDSIGKEAGYQVLSKLSVTEYKGSIDVSYFSPTDRYCWSPFVFIEHENKTDFDSAWRDYHKLCLYAVPLRVFIGYGELPEEAKHIGEALIGEYQRVGLHQIEKGETLLIMSCRPRIPTDDWFMWRCRGTQVWEPFMPV